MNYGVPYQGSKNKIAKWVIDQLPKGKRLIDLFGGGGAITHCAYLSGKWNTVVYNELDPLCFELFRDTINGKYIDFIPEFVTREKFHEQKENDGYIKYIWSFGNTGTSYLFGKNIEEYKHKAHDFVVFEDKNAKLWLENHLNVDLFDVVGDTWQERRRKFSGKLRAIKKQRYTIELQQLQQLQRLQQLEGLEQLQRLERLQLYNLDYEQVELQEGDVIYCDIPYANTDCKSYNGFDHDRFYKWARKQNNIYISEYNMPDDFVVIAEKQKKCTMDDKQKDTTERIYTNGTGLLR